jgi:hypothetical protein
MNDDLIEIVSRELRRVSSDTADCPNLVHRVAAGVTRRRRQRAVGAALAAVAAAVLTPALLLGTGALGGSSGSGASLSAGASAKADLALRRANPDVAAPARLDADQPSCERRLHCRGPV